MTLIELLRLSLPALTALGLLTGLAAAWYAFAAALVRAAPAPIIATLKVAARPDDQAGDAAVIAMQAADQARVLAAEAKAASGHYKIAAVLTIISVTLISAAAFIGALSIAP